MARNHYGTDNSDTIHGTSGHWPDGDAIWGYGGDDEIYAGDGWDYLTGGAGADYLDGGSGQDQTIYADSAVGVTVFLSAGVGMGGTAEGDVLVSIEDLAGSEHDDVLSGTDHYNSLFGRGGNDTMKGGGGYDRLSGDAGDDLLKGGGGADVLHGGAGFDTASYEGSSAGVVVSLITDSAAYGDAQGDELDSIEGLTGSDFVDTLIGDDGINVLTGLRGNDTLKGYGDDDTLHGGDGNDFLDGGYSYDEMIGGLGNDTYIVDNPYDALTEYGGQGTDVVRTSVSYQLTPGADIELLETTDANGTTPLILFGNSSGNNIIGNNGDNLISGEGGVDLMTGRAGNDTYFVDHTNDRVTENGGQGNDTVRSSVSYQLTAGADVETLETNFENGTAAINLTGNANGNVVRGNNGNNTLNGGDGDDDLTGFSGQDRFLFNTPLNAANNVDRITDFNVTDDTILLDNAVFSALGLGTISADQFVISTSPQDANDRIIYDSNTGGLYYDADGTGGGSGIQFAEVGRGLALTNADFLVVSGTQIPSFGGGRVPVAPVATTDLAIDGTTNFGRTSTTAYVDLNSGLADYLV
jgi:Ca2+-binding RTX toxin-like protein